VLVALADDKVDTTVEMTVTVCDMVLASLSRWTGEISVPSRTGYTPLFNSAAVISDEARF